MIPFIGIVTIIVSTVIVVKKTIKADVYEKYVDAFIKGIFTLMIGTLLLMGILCLCVAPLPNTSYQDHKNIVSLTSNVVTEGHFFLGCGSIDGEEYYFFYVERSDGGYVRDKIEVEDVVLYETNEISPRLEWTVIVPKETDRTKFFIGENLHRICQDKKDYKLIVPKNTIIQKFELR